MHTAQFRTRFDPHIICAAFSLFLGIWGTGCATSPATKPSGEAQTELQISRNQSQHVRLAVTGDPMIGKNLGGAKNLASLIPCIERAQDLSKSKGGFIWLGPELPKEHLKDLEKDLNQLGWVHGPVDLIQTQGAQISISRTMDEFLSSKSLGNVSVLIVEKSLSCPQPKSTSRFHLKADRYAPCDPRSEFFDAFENLPKTRPQKFPDLIVTRGPSPAALWMERLQSTPVVQGESLARSFYLVDVPIDPVTKRPIAEKMTIEGPNKCEGTHSGLLFQRSQSLIEKLEAYEPENRNRIGSLPLPLDHQFPCKEPTALGTYMADLMREKTGSDFAILPCGIFSKGLSSGDIQEKDLDQAIPFDQSLVELNLSKAEFELMVKIIFNGSRGYGAISGFKLRLLPFSKEGSAKDLNGDRRISTWEINRVVKFRYPNSKKRQVKVVLPSHLVKGGDDLKWWVKQIQPTQWVKHETPLPTIKELLRTELSSNPQKSTNLEPRIEFSSNGR